MYTQALENRIDADLHLGRHREVIAELRQCTAAHPLREHLHGMLMLALYYDGRAAETLAAYQNARRAMIGELGIEPGPDLRQLHLRILRADPAWPRSCGRRLALPGISPRNAGPSQRNVRLMPIPRQLSACGTHSSGERSKLPCSEPCWTRQRGVGANPRARRDHRHDAARGDPGCGAGKTALALHFAHLTLNGIPMGSCTLTRVVRSAGRAAPRHGGHARTLRCARCRCPPPDPRRTGGAGPDCSRRAPDAGHARERGQRSAGGPLLPGGGDCLAAVVTSRRQLTALAHAQGAHTVVLDVLTDTDAHELLASRLGPAQLAAYPEAAHELTAACVGYRWLSASSPPARRPGRDSHSPCSRPGYATRARRHNELQPAA